MQGCPTRAVPRSQVHASADRLRLITFDADGTLYADGCHMEQDNKMIDSMIDLMTKRVYVAIVTAAGYPGQPALFEGRIRGLLDAFKDRGLSSEITDRFLVLGGECNYLLRCAAHLLTPCNVYASLFKLLQASNAQRKMRAAHRHPSESVCEQVQPR